MAKNTKAQSTEDKPKRTILTPEERVAKLERELAEAKVKAQAKDRKRLDVVIERRALLQAKVDGITKQLTELSSEQSELETKLGIVTDEGNTPEAVES